ncbi:MAG TPA: [Fe-Fe] hydrogenase large subunit C-terminal domain-containing protein [Gemmatimonadaceae bacterium]|nr:[Fe-Fe] hydrogenase large subunit C-terminal domain-containing protein [Gemmatimonadaceae bacterium]
MSRRPTSESSPASVVILGADAVLAALPATSVQLAHACRALGYDMAFPATWGDELVAEGCLRYLAAHEPETAILSACPHVVDRLTRAGAELVPHMIVLAAPPVAAARYVRAAFAQRKVHVTYVGSCPAADHPSIDARLEPGAFLDALVERGIVLADLPEFFESVLPPDRRRYLSLPGGVPSAEHLAAHDPRRALVELDGEDFLVDLAQRLLARQHALIDVSLAAGCACAGSPRGARATLVALEPPRARAPVLDPSIAVDVAQPDTAERMDAGRAEHEQADEPAPPVPNPTPVTRATNPPAVRRAGSAIPRAFAAHRALAKRRERAPVAHAPTTYSTRPRSTSPPPGPVIPLSTDRPSFVPPPFVPAPPPLPGKMRTGPADHSPVAPTSC